MESPSTPDEVRRMEGDDQREFWGHVEELRRRLVFWIVSLILGSALGFMLAERIVAFIASPATAAGAVLTALRPQDKFVAYLQAALAFGLVASLPVALFQLGRFIGPALENRERRLLRAGFGGVACLSLAGVAFARYVLLPFAASFFSSFAAGDGIGQLWGLGAWFSLAFGLMLACAVVFQFPVVTLMLFALGLLSPSVVARYRRHAVVAIAILSGLITPDLVTQALVGAPLWLLFELTLGVGRLMRAGRLPRTEAAS